jgi:hypothetical protein
MAKRLNTDGTDYGWFTRQEMAEIFAVTKSTFDLSYKRYAEPNEIRKSGTRTLYKARPILERWADATRTQPIDLGDDAALFSGGGSSPALERCREEKARLLKLEYESKSKSVVKREDIREGLDEIARRLRQMAEVFQREFGPSAIDLYDETLTDIEAAITRMFVNGESDDTDGDAKAGG